MKITHFNGALKSKLTVQTTSYLAIGLLRSYLSGTGSRPLILVSLNQKLPSKQSMTLNYVVVSSYENMLFSSCTRRNLRIFNNYHLACRLLHAVLPCIATCPCFRGNEGQTPLVKASLKGHHSVVKLLLKRGVIVEQQDLHAAIEEGNK